MRRVALGGLVAACLVLSGLVTAEPATAAKRITFARPTIKTDTVVFKGRTAKPRVKVRLQKRRGGRWVTIETDRSNRKGRFRFREPLPTTDTRYRARWRRHASRTRLVRATVTLARPVVGDDAAVLRGRTSRPRVTVDLHRRESAGWEVVASRRTAWNGRFRFRQPVPTVDTTYRAKWRDNASVARVVRGRDECGVRPRKADGTLWSCDMVDHFEGSALDRSVWTPLVQLGRGDELACNVDDPRTVAVHSGALHLTVRRAGGTLLCPMGPLLTRPGTYASGSITTRMKRVWQYGRFEARIMPAPTVYPGLHEAFWMWPAQDLLDILWPEAGEIDIAETYSQYPHLVVPFLHYRKDDNAGPVPGLNTAWDCPAQRGVWNTFALEWTADRLAISANGRMCLVNTDGAATFRKKFFLLLTQLIGRKANAHDGRAPMPATMKVDYVKVWQ